MSRAFEGGDGSGARAPTSLGQDLVGTCQHQCVQMQGLARARLAPQSKDAEEGKGLCPGPEPGRGEPE